VNLQICKFVAKTYKNTSKTNHNVEIINQAVSRQSQFKKKHFVMVDP